MFGIVSIVISVATSVVEFDSIATWLGQYRSSPAGVGVERVGSLACLVKSWTLMCDDSGGRMVSSEVVCKLFYPARWSDYAMGGRYLTCDDMCAS